MFEGAKSQNYLHNICPAAASWALVPIKSLKLSSEGFYSSPVTSALLIQCSGFLPFNWAGQVVYWNSKKGSQCQILESC